MKMFSIDPVQLGKKYCGNRKTYINDAAILLSETKRPIAEISEQVGYSNQGKLAAMFKKKFGLSPLEYRRLKNLENDEPQSRDFTSETGELPEK